MLRIVSLRKQPELRKQVFGEAIQSLWPVFMCRDPTAMFYFDEPDLDHNLDTAFAVVDSTQPDVVVGRAFAVPFALYGIEGRTELPDGGWDEIIRWAYADRVLGRRPDAISALEITLVPSHRGRGGAQEVLDAMRARAAALGYRHMFAPVRPTAKHLSPLEPMAEYAMRVRSDGLPEDPWLRVHARVGGVIVKVAPTSMVIAGTLSDWHRWTGISFTASGPAIVPGALVPVHVSLEQDHAVYVEPNVWVRHAVPPVRYLCQ